jgi:hypothetical protein
MGKHVMKDQHWLGSTDDPGAEPVVPTLGTIIIRTWLESGHSRGFRARITFGPTPGYDQSTVTTADPGEVLEVVQHWLATQPGLSGRN